MKAVLPFYQVEVWLIIDCFAAHRDTTFLQMLRDRSITPFFIPGGLTSIAQVHDTHINKSFKAAISEIQEGTPGHIEGSLIFSTPLSACLSVPTYPVAVLEPRYPAFASIPHPLRFYAAFREMLAAFNAYTEQMDGFEEGQGGGDEKRSHLRHRSRT